MLFTFKDAGPRPFVGQIEYRGMKKTRENKNRFTKCLALHQARGKQTRLDWSIIQGLLWFIANFQGSIYLRDQLPSVQMLAQIHLLPLFI
jgi:hypothetical protein